MLPKNTLSICFMALSVGGLLAGPALLIGSAAAQSGARNQGIGTAGRNASGVPDCSMSPFPTFTAGAPTTNGPVLSLANCAAIFGNMGPCTVGPDPCEGCDDEQLTYFVTSAAGADVDGSNAVDTDSNLLLRLPQFNPSNGVLKHVEVRAKILLTNDGSDAVCYGSDGFVLFVENTSPSITCDPFGAVAQPWSVVVDAQLDLVGPAQTLITFLNTQPAANPCTAGFSCSNVAGCACNPSCGNSNPNCPLATYDGVIDGCGPSGAFTRLNPFYLCSVECVDDNDGVGLDLMDFEGVGNLDICANVDADRLIGDQGKMCGNGLSGLLSEYVVEVEVTYTYCGNTPPVPCDDDGGMACPPTVCQPDAGLCPPPTNVCTPPVDILANDCDPDCCGPCDKRNCGRNCGNTCTGDDDAELDPFSVILCPNSTACANVNVNNPGGGCQKANAGPIVVNLQGLGEATYTPATGLITFCPFANANNTRSPKFATAYYRVADKSGCYSENCAAVTFTILPKPNAVNDTDDTCADECRTIDLAGNDLPSTNGNNSDVVPGTVEICVLPDHGTVYQPGDAGIPAGFNPGPGEVVYCPDAGYVGNDTFQYRIQNGYGCYSNCATVTVVINEPPVCAPDDLGYVCEPTPGMQPDTLTINPLANDNLGAGNPVLGTVMLCTSSSCTTGCVGPNQALDTPQGTAVYNPATGLITYTPDLNGRGQDVFYYKYLDDNGCASGCCAVTAFVVARPVALDDFAPFDPDTMTDVEVCVVDNDFDQDGDLANCTNVYCPGGCQPVYNIEICPGMGPQFGTITNIDQVNGKITYEPGAGFDRLDCFYYTVTDCFGCKSDCAKVTIEVPQCIDVNRRVPGSLLIYPEYDNRNGCKTVITITNTRSFGGAVDVEFRYIDESDCLHFGRTDRLTPRDTLTVCTDDHGPSSGRGWLYAFAKEPNAQGRPFVWNFLIGQILRIDGYDVADYAMNAVSFRGIGETGDLTDDPADNGCGDEDGIRDLDGCEYEEAPDEIFIPRFLGQDDEIQSELILIALSGGVAFTTRADFWIYNDNEQQFSGSRTFYCWTKVPLLAISMIFDNEVLQLYTDDDPLEIFDPDMIFDDEQRESGWFKIRGGFATSGIKNIDDPVVYGVLVESRMFTPAGAAPVTSFAADLPWEWCSQDNASLLPKSPWGDNSD